jgi:hypothetical protein
VLLSVSTPTSPELLAQSGCEEVPEIEAFLSTQRGVRFKGGRIESGIDTVLFATGFLFTFPFLTSLIPPLVTTGRRVFGLYKDFLHIDHPTLVFSGLPIKVVPFPFAESQAAIFSRVWANVLELPSGEEMKQWEDEESKRRGDTYHVYPKGGDADFINATHDWLTTLQAPGKVPPTWDSELIWQRQIYKEAKFKFEMTGRSAKSLQELGFERQSEPSQKKAPEIP